MIELILSQGKHLQLVAESNLLMHKFKVLILYPNSPLLNPPPVSIGIFVSLLKQEGYDIKIFDTTFYVDNKNDSDKQKEETLQVKPFSFNKFNLPLRNNQPEEDFLDLVIEYKPNLILTSILEFSWPLAARILESIIGLKVPVLAGGVFPTFEFELVLKHPAINMVCRGEGEGTVVDVCKAINNGEDYSSIPNIVFQDNERLRVNRVRLTENINELPIPDYSVFHEARLLRPMGGEVYKTIPIETNRGCPYSCSFCNSPSISNIYKNSNSGHFFRKKTIDRIEEELIYLVDKHKAEYVYFLSDTFLSLSNLEFDLFIDIYKKINKPFWIQTRVETINKYRVKKLKEIGCHRMSIGVEHGNENFRRKILNKKFSNNELLEKTSIITDVGIPLTVNNIIGFPDETRKLIFDTIELNREINSESVNAYIYTPFHGTELFNECLKKGYLDNNNVSGHITMDSVLNMKLLTKQEIIGLQKTFVLYTKMPRKYWETIRVAELDSSEGKDAFKTMKKKYLKEYCEQL
jgi:anaerobic magnesium-protoporphyrin IX monomethyl ester cyclase